MVRSIDLVPTLLDLTGLSAKEYDFDGQSMLSVINKNETRDEVYSEDLFESRGEGALQSLRTKDFKFIRNLTLGTEEYYDLNDDPQEQHNLVKKTNKEKLITIRKKMNVFLKTKVASGKEFSQKEREVINQRLRALGYIE